MRVNLCYAEQALHRNHTDTDTCHLIKDMAVLNLMKVLTLHQALIDGFPISCKQGNYRFLNIELAKTSLWFTSFFMGLDPLSRLIVKIDRPGI